MSKNTETPDCSSEPEREVSISPRKLLEAALYKAWVTVRKEDKLTKSTIDGVVQILKLYRDYTPQQDVPKNYRVEWVTESELASTND